MALQWLGGLEMGDFMLLNGLERGEPTLLACAGLCDREPRLSTFGEQVSGVPCVRGLCTGKLPKLAEVEDTELIPAGLDPDEVRFRGLHPEGLFSWHKMGLLTAGRRAPPFTAPPESIRKDRKGRLTLPRAAGRWPFSL